jgi:hypothetical protein
VVSGRDAGRPEEQAYLPLGEERGTTARREDQRTQSTWLFTVMLGFKQFRHAAITIARIELMHRIRKGQFGLRRLGVRGRAAPAV